MKMILMVLLTLAAQMAFGADDFLVTKALKNIRGAQLTLDRAITNGSTGGSSQRQLERIARQLAEAQEDLERALRRGENSEPEYRHARNEFYCAAACTASDRVTPDIRTTVGAVGAFETEAKTNAISAVQTQNRCGWGAVVTECSVQTDDNRFDSAAACTNGSGEADLRTVRSGQGRSKVEAQVNARQKAQTENKCGWGLKDVFSSAYLEPSYCAAACTDGSGVPDVRQSKGARGRSKADAQAQALRETQTAFRCGWGIKVTQCEER